MKKQIAILATMVAASGFSAFGQDWITFGTANATWIYDEFTTPGTGIYAGNGDNVNVTFLWDASTSLTGNSADLLSAVGTEFGQKNGAAVDQVATNGVTSVAAANPESEIASMLANGWQLGNNYSSGSGSAATGSVIASAGIIGTRYGGVPEYNGGSSFEVSTTSTGVSGSDIEVIMLAYVGSSYSSATDLGWSNPFLNGIGSSAGDSNGDNPQSFYGLNQFGVAAVTGVPEPTTLALAGLGGLSMLFLRRRKA